MRISDWSSDVCSSDLGLVVIGDELLSGRTQDANIANSAKWLNVQGVRLAEVRIVADLLDQIVGAVHAIRTAHDYVLTTGGIGPTHDDITVDSVSHAFGSPVVLPPRPMAVLDNHYQNRGG